MSINRSSFNPELHTPKIKRGKNLVYATRDEQPLSPIPLEVFSTTNPSGPGHGVVKKRFITPAKYGEIIRKDISYFDPSINEERNIVRTQVAIFGSFYENPFLDPVYKAGLIESCSSEPHLHEAWIKGSWDATAGGAIDDLWKSKIHVIDRFKIPDNWKIDRSFDWGSTHPCACVWWAEANGEEVLLPNGKTWCPQRGSLIAIAEDYTVANDSYGNPDLSVNKGLKISAKDVALRIINVEKRLLDEKWIARSVQSGPADNQIRDVRESDVQTIEQKMSELGVRWTKSDKSKGSRVIGLQMMREYLQASVVKEKPGIYFMRNCEACVELLPPLPRDPKNLDDVDTESMDHIWDAVRYRVLRGSNRFATEIKTDMPY